MSTPPTEREIRAIIDGIEKVVDVRFESVATQIKELRSDIAEIREQTMESSDHITKMDARKIVEDVSESVLSKILADFSKDIDARIIKSKKEAVAESIGKATKKVTALLVGSIVSAIGAGVALIWTMIIRGDM